MSDELIVQYGSPTLAGIKTGSLFTCPYTDRQQTMCEMRRLNRKLVPKGLRILPLRYSAERVLVYLYRPARLEKDLSNKDALDLLENAGYRHGSADQCVIELIRRLNDLESEFPHEIGLFLSYPPEDVKGFIENKPGSCKCTGCWKVYGDCEKAAKTFAKYQKCTDIYCKCHRCGTNLEKLTISS
jgi:hypothetical protein